jgi:hypothetical protein
VTYPATPTRFIHVVGWRGTCMLWWAEAGSCRPGLGHTIRHELRHGDGEMPEHPAACEGWQEWYPELGTKCDCCDAIWPGLEGMSEAELDLVHHSGGSEPTYDTESGKQEPGCMYWNTHMPHDGQTCSFYKWTNCDGRHLMVVLPNGISWDVDSRASNCDKQDDTTHRCWVRKGNPETEPVTAGKDGPTCTAGAGSIASGDYHGYLQAGILTAG